MKHQYHNGMFQKAISPPPPGFSLSFSLTNHTSLSSQTDPTLALKPASAACLPAFMWTCSGVCLGATNSRGRTFSQSLLQGWLQDWPEELRTATRLNTITLLPLPVWLRDSWGTKSLSIQFEERSVPGFFFEGGAQPVPKSWSRDFLIVLNTRPCLGSLLASSFNLY